jgi:hypothetical protein
MLGHAQNSSTCIFTLHTVQDVCIVAEAVLLFHGQTRIVCVYAVVGVVVLEAVFCRHAIHAYTRHHVRTHACLFVGVQHSRQPSVAQHSEGAVQDNLS